MTQHHPSMLLSWARGREVVSAWEFRLKQVTEKQQPWL